MEARPEGTEAFMSTDPMKIDDGPMESMNVIKIDALASYYRLFGISHMQHDEELPVSQGLGCGR